MSLDPHFPSEVTDINLIIQFQTNAHINEEEYKPDSRNTTLSTTNNQPHVSACTAILRLNTEPKAGKQFNTMQ
jgi:hypothetical protein